METDGSITPIGPLKLVDFTTAGYPGGIPDIDTNIIEVVNNGAACNGTTDDSAAIQAAIDGASTPAVVLLPAGTCLIESQLELSSGVVLRGLGSNASVLLCRSEPGCIRVQGSITGDYASILDGLEQGSSLITVSNGSGFSPGQGAEIRQENIIPASAEWGEHDVGQMARIVAVDGDSLTIDPPLHITYSADKNPQIRPIDFEERSGVEDLTLRRIDSGGESGNNIDFRRAAECWVRRVESDFTEKYHISISESLRIEVRDSFIHDAKSKGDGGQGYGASLARYATSVLVENNIFYETRHAMIIQLGASGCVFGYNYSEKNYSDDGWDKPSISLHGHYPFMNLYESNIVGWVGVGDYWGPVGPGNTLFRNWVRGTDRHQDFGDSRGIDLEEYHGTQLVMGNEVGGEGILGDTSDAVIHGNNVLGEVGWDPEISDHTLPSSYYLLSKPDFYGSMDWPSLGGDRTYGEGTIPALERWLSGDHVPQP